MFKLLVVITFILLLLAIALPFGRVQSATCGTNHTVTAGETLSLIAHNCNTSVNKLLAANPNLPKNGYVAPGTVIFIPSDNSSVAAAPPVVPNVVVVTGEQPSIPTTGDPIITVQPGDTLGSLAVKYSTTLDVILRMNPDIQNPNLIYPGQQIHVP